MITIIITLILNLLLGAPANEQNKTTTDEQPINTMGGGTTWVNNDKVGGN